MRSAFWNSEAAFCWMLGELERSHCRGLLNPNDAAAIFQELLRCSRELSDRGSFNALISNGHWLYAYSGTRLHRLTRRAPFRQACLTDDDLSVDFSQLTQPQDVVTVLSTEPLTRDEPWTALQRGEALLLRHGELVQQALPTAG